MSSDFYKLSLSVIFHTEKTTRRALLNIEAKEKVFPEMISGNTGEFIDAMR